MVWRRYTLVRVVAWLPGEDVLACRTVCRRWKTIISHALNQPIPIVGRNLVVCVGVGTPTPGLVPRIQILTGTLCSDTTLGSILARWPSIQSIDMSLCGTLSKWVTDEVFDIPRHSFLWLRRITLSYYCRITDAAIVSVARECPSLRRLDMNGFDRCLVTEIGFQALAAGCPKLHSITASWFVTPFDTVGALAALAKGCPGLRRFDVTHSSVFEDASLIVLFENCRQLQDVGLLGCDQLTDAALYGRLQERYRRGFRCSREPLPKPSHFIPVWVRRYGCGLRRHCIQLRHTTTP